MKIVRAKLADARKMSLLRRKTIRKINKNDYPQIFIDTLVNKNSSKKIRDRMKVRDTFCIWRGRNILGTIDLERDKIGGLFVKSSEIGKGVGTKLMDFIEEYARSKKIRKVRLYSTKFAFNFYKKRGYKLVKSGYWKIGKFKSKDRLMVKKL